MNKGIILIFGFCVMFACKSDTSPKNSMARLDTVEKQTAFLMDIFNKDQQVRKDEKIAIQNFGMNSPQHEAAINALMTTDEINLQAIESYLKTHPHPIREQHGREATDTPWLVVHHAVGGKGLRKKHFPTFYKAYKDGEIYGNALTMYLNRLYNLEFNARIEWDRPYNEGEELDTLIKSLGLNELIK